uniref:NADH-ubiquinone oxidoreductase chain 2 n=1 Tax=Medetera sp. Qilemoge-2020 TaxID=2766003 RepID=A0A7G8JTP3_9MUSC|nr:NADH dehydrogenase subunit 2 [Medetera sp. Qilemoge-2020]
MKNTSKMLFMTVLVTGTLMAVTANSWLSVWMGLEINLMAFIPLMNDISNLKSSEASLKYFLAQALASSTLLFAVIMMLMNSNFMFQINLESNNLSEMIILSSLLMKSGTAPFHLWFTEVIEGLSWNNALILMTWQKLAPLMLISYITMSQFIIIIILITSITGALGGLNMTSLRKLMAFSSINHLGWMLAAMHLKNNIWLIYFLFYVLLSAIIVMMFNMFKIFHFNQMFSLSLPSNYFKMSMLINLLSLGGLPPFLGFIPKWIVIQALSNNNQMTLAMLLIMATLITLFFYLRLCFSATMINYYETNWMPPIKLNNLNYMTMNFLSVISTFGLILMPMMYLML